MLTAIQEKIVAGLEAISVFKTAGVWQGDVKELLDTVHKLPSAHVMLSTGEFDQPRIIGGKITQKDITWSIIVLSESVRDRKSGAVGSLTLLDALLVDAREDIPGLSGLDTGYGRLWPTDVAFLGSEGGKAAYGMKFILESWDQ